MIQIDMKMPEHCVDCPFSLDNCCLVLGKYIPLKQFAKGGIQKWCSLKEQEAVKLHTIDTDEEQYSFWFVCGNCGWKIYKVVDDENCEDRNQIHFCASCGRPISWGGL